MRLFTSKSTPHTCCNDVKTRTTNHTAGSGAGTVCGKCPVWSRPGRRIAGGRSQIPIIPTNFFCSFLTTRDSTHRYICRISAQPSWESLTQPKNVVRNQNIQRFFDPDASHLHPGLLSTYNCSNTLEDTGQNARRRSKEYSLDAGRSRLNTSAKNIFAFFDSTKMHHSSFAPRTPLNYSGTSEDTGWTAQNVLCVPALADRQWEVGHRSPSTQPFFSSFFSVFFNTWAKAKNLFFFLTLLSLFDPTKMHCCWFEPRTSLNYSGTSEDSG